MFGYIKPFKPEMKIKEYDTFKAVYCGLCKQLSKSFGPFASLTLSYDFTFVAIISLGLKNEFCGFKKCSCVANPLIKKQCVLPCDDLSFCAYTAMLMIYHKVKDDIQDSSFFKKIPKYLLLPFVSSARKKALKKYKYIDDIISFSMTKQHELELSNVTSIDKAADPSADALAQICEGLSDDITQKKILHRFAYILGRYVYFADALDDLESDIKSGGYNPFLAKYRNENISLKNNPQLLSSIKEYAVEVLNLTIGELCPAYELLPFKRYKSILDNIIYLGLHNEINQILVNKNKKENKNDKSI